MVYPFPVTTKVQGINGGVGGLVGVCFFFYKKWKRRKKSGSLISARACVCMEEDRMRLSRERVYPVILLFLLNAVVCVCARASVCVFVCVCVEKQQQQEG